MIPITSSLCLLYAHDKTFGFKLIVRSSDEQFSNLDCDPKSEQKYFYLKRSNNHTTTVQGQLQCISVDELTN
jgi:hypothetical protein